MVYRLSNKSIDLRPDRTFTIQEQENIISGTYVKSILDTNKFIITFTTTEKKFLMYFDLDMGIVTGDTEGTQKLKSFGKQTIQSVLRDKINKLISVVKGWRYTRWL